LPKEQGSSNQVQNRGHKGPVLRPRWFVSGRARTPMVFYFILSPLYFIWSIYIYCKII
jgi:hypothetical protein